jgi:hypothetical protein
VIEENVLAGDGAVAAPQHTMAPDVLSTPQPETVLNTALENCAAGVSMRWSSIGGHQGVPSAASPHVAQGAPPTRPMIQMAMPDRARTHGRS